MLLLTLKLRLLKHKIKSFLTLLPVHFLPLVPFLLRAPFSSKPASPSCQPPASLLLTGVEEALAHDGDIFGLRHDDFSLKERL